MIGGPVCSRHAKQHFVGANHPSSGRHHPFVVRHPVRHRDWSRLEHVVDLARVTVGPSEPSTARPVSPASEGEHCHHARKESTASRTRASSGRRPSCLVPARRSYQPEAKYSLRAGVIAISLALANAWRAGLWTAQMRARRVGGIAREARQHAWRPPTEVQRHGAWVFRMRRDGRRHDLSRAPASGLPYSSQ